MGQRGLGCLESANLAKNARPVSGLAEPFPGGIPGRGQRPVRVLGGRRRSRLMLLLRMLLAAAAVAVRVAATASLRVVLPIEICDVRAAPRGESLTVGDEDRQNAGECKCHDAHCCLPWRVSRLTVSEAELKGNGGGQVAIESVLRVTAKIRCPDRGRPRHCACLVSQQPAWPCLLRKATCANIGIAIKWVLTAESSEKWL